MPPPTGPSPASTKVRTLDRTLNDEENSDLVLQATWFEVATYLHGEGRVRVCEDFFVSAMSRGLEDHQRIGGTCGRKDLEN